MKRWDNTKKYTNDEIERAWPNGPWRRIGSGRGKPSKYVCQGCRTQVVGVYYLKPSGNEAGMWVCGACRTSLLPKHPEPAGLRKHRLGANL